MSVVEDERSRCAIWEKMTNEQALRLDMESWGDPDGGAVRRLTPEQEEEEAPRRTWSVMFRMNGVGSDVEVSSMTWEPRQYHIMYYREELEATGFSVHHPEEERPLIPCDVSYEGVLFVVLYQIRKQVCQLLMIRDGILQCKWGHNTLGLMEFIRDLSQVREECREYALAYVIHVPGNNVYVSADYLRNTLWRCQGHRWLGEEVFSRPYLGMHRYDRYLDQDLANWQVDRERELMVRFQLSRKSSVALLSHLVNQGQGRSLNRCGYTTQRPTLQHLALLELMRTGQLDWARAMRETDHLGFSVKTGTACSGASSRERRWSMTALIREACGDEIGGTWV